MPSRHTQSPSPDHGTVVDLGTARERARLHRCRERVDLVLSQNKRALELLFDTGLVFSRAGTRTGRDLLGAHHQLLRLSDVLNRAEKARTSAPLSAEELDALFVEVEALLEKTSEVARRHRTFFELQRGR